MNIMQIGILAFVFIECLNVIILYFYPTSTKGNGVGVFNAYEESKDNDNIYDFVCYLVNWVAGCKLIFIMVGIVIVIFGNYYTQLFTLVALIISILSFYWRLYPMIKSMDKRNYITPKGYSRILNFMILTFIIGFIVILCISLYSKFL